MLITTTNNIDGYRVTEYREIVFGEVISGVNFIKDIGAGFRNIFGGRAQGYEDELLKAREEVLQELKVRAEKCGADAVIGVKMDYEVLGQNGSMLMVTASGTAVCLSKE